MSEKVYEAATLLSAAKERVKGYKSLKKDIEALKKTMQAVVDLGDNLKGKGADNIKSFYKGHVDIADQWLNLINARIEFFSNLSIPMESENLSGKTVVYEAFLEGDLKQANAQSITMVKEQKKALQDIFNEIDDIISLTVFSDKTVMNDLDHADDKREKNLKAVESFDKDMTKEYEMMDSFIQTVVASVNQLLSSTAQNGEVSPMNFDKKSYESSEVYKLQKDMNKQATSYVDYKKEQRKGYEDFKRAQAEANKPWYEKTWDTVVNFTGEITGYYDYKRAKDGVDPVTHEKLTTAQRATSAAMAAAGFIPFVGWGGRIVKGGSALYKTTRGIQAANGALKAYKTEKTFDALYTVERGIYGLTAANGFNEYVFGRDFLGNELTDEQRQMSLYQSLGLLGGSFLTSRNVGTYYQTGKQAVTNPKATFQSFRNVLNKDNMDRVLKDTYKQVQDGTRSFKEGMKNVAQEFIPRSNARPLLETIGGGVENSSPRMREALGKTKDRLYTYSQKTVNKLNEKMDNVSNSLKNVVQNTTEKINSVRGKNSVPSTSNKIDLPLERKKHYRMKIDEAETLGDYNKANDIRFERYSEETVTPLSRNEWDVKQKNLRQIQKRGREEELKGRKALEEHLDRKLEDNNAGEVVTYMSSEGHLTRPDSIGRNDKNEIDLVHDHKHKMGGEDQVIHNDKQMRAEKEMIEAADGKHVVTMSSDKPDLDGIPPNPRPSGPLGQESNIYYTDPSSGKVTHEWLFDKDLPGGGEWIKL